MRAEVRSASGNLVKMCFITKRFEVDGQWVSIEALLKQWLGLRVSHGLSPEGLAQLDPIVHTRTHRGPHQSPRMTTR